MSLQPLSGRLAVLERRVLAQEAVRSTASLSELAGVLGDIDHDLRAVTNILDEHAALRPSGIWVAIAVLSGLGGLFLMEITPFSLLVAIGGLAGAIKALFDLARHTVQEQQILRV